jgi:RNA polymerase-binding transcription factor DksA
MTEKRREKLYHDLLRLKGGVLVRIERAKHNLNESNTETRGDEAMLANRQCISFTESTIISVANREMRLIDDALHRLSANNPDEPYGVCVDCRAEISLQRLAATPFAVQCIKCAARGEETILDPHGVY